MAVSMNTTDTFFRRWLKLQSKTKAGDKTCLLSRSRDCKITSRRALLSYLKLMSSPRQCCTWMRKIWDRYTAIISWKFKIYRILRKKITLFRAFLNSNIKILRIIRLQNLKVPWVPKFKSRKVTLYLHTIQWLNQDLEFTELIARRSLRSMMEVCKILVELVPKLWKKSLIDLDLVNFSRVTMKTISATL